MRTIGRKIRRTTIKTRTRGKERRRILKNIRYIQVTKIFEANVH